MPLSIVPGAVPTITLSRVTPEAEGVLATLNRQAAEAGAVTIQESVRRIIFRFSSLTEDEGDNAVIMSACNRFMALLGEKLAETGVDISREMSLSSKKDDRGAHPNYNFKQ